MRTESLVSFLHCFTPVVKEEAFRKCLRKERVKERKAFFEAKVEFAREMFPMILDQSVRRGT